MQYIPRYVRKYKKLFITAFVVVFIYVSMVAILYSTDSGTFKGGTLYSGVQVENLNVGQANEKIVKNIENTAVIITTTTSTLKTTASKLGVEVDNNKLKADINAQRLRYALFPFIYSKDNTAPYTINDEILLSTIRRIEIPADNKPPIDAQVIVKDDTIVVLPDSSGLGIEKDVIKNDLASQLQAGSNNIAIAAELRDVPPNVTASELHEKFDEIRKTVTAIYTVSDGKTSVVIPPNDIAATLTILDNQLVPSYTASSTAINKALTAFNHEPIAELIYSYSSGKMNKTFQVGINGSTITNSEDLIEQLQTAIRKGEPATLSAKNDSIPYATKTFKINDTTNKIMKYSLETWGNTKTPIHEFREKATETLVSNLGWSRANYTFEEVATGSDFTLVLSEGTELSRRYAPTCDSYYSCRVGRYVIINDSRWQSATPVWTKDLRSYQHLVINHETGHLLGLRHYFCSTAGAPAPVMQQQSIEIRNCSFNEWPLDYEITKLN